MNNVEKYNKVFCDIFMLSEVFDSKTLKFNETKDWDSVGHMALITALEDAFDFMFETEDILLFSSYHEGMELLKKYGIEM